MNDIEMKRQAETVMRLAGELPRNQREAAVLVEDLAAILTVDKTLQSDLAAGSAPTKAEFDALVADVQMLHRRIYALMLDLQKRLI